MATYLELKQVQTDALNETNDLLQKVEVAVWVAAHAIKDEVSPTAERLAWASSSLNDPKGTALDMLPVLLAANKANTVAQITGATDAQIQTEVNNAVIIFAGN